MPADGSFHDSDRRVRKEIYERGTFGGVDFMQIKRITALLLTAIPNIVPVQFTDGAYYNFPDDWKCPRCKQPREKFNRA